MNSYPMVICHHIGDGRGGAGRNRSDGLSPHSTRTAGTGAGTAARTAASRRERGTKEVGG